MTTDEIRRVRYTQLITDPFPEHTSYEMLKRGSGVIERVLGYPGLPSPPEPISIWAAYQKGYEKAYAEMLAAADLLERTPDTSVKATCVCGHSKEAHIYHEGACRPGFACQNECRQYLPVYTEGERKV
jgi:hypothetical protein